MYGIFTYIWLIFYVNVGKYTIHGCYGYWDDPKLQCLQMDIRHHATASLCLSKTFLGGDTLPETDISPENRGPLESRRFRHFQTIIFWGLLLLVLGRISPSFHGISRMTSDFKIKFIQTSIKARTPQSRQGPSRTGP